MNRPDRSRASIHVSESRSLHRICSHGVYTTHGTKWKSRRFFLMNRAAQFVSTVGSQTIKEHGRMRSSNPLSQEKWDELQATLPRGSQVKGRVVLNLSSRDYHVSKPLSPSKDQRTKAPRNDDDHSKTERPALLEFRQGQRLGVARPSPATRPRSRRAPDDVQRNVRPGCHTRRAAGTGRSSGGRGQSASRLGDAAVPLLERDLRGTHEGGDRRGEGFGCYSHCVRRPVPRRHP